MHAEDDEANNAIHVYCEPAMCSQTVMADVRLDI